MMCRQIPMPKIEHRQRGEGGVISRSKVRKADFVTGERKPLLSLHLDRSAQMHSADTVPLTLVVHRRLAAKAYHERLFGTTRRAAQLLRGSSLPLM